MHAKQLTEFVKEYKFTKQELEILMPLQKRKEQLERDIKHFVVSKVVPRLPKESNKKYNVQFDLYKGTIKLKAHYKTMIQANEEMLRQMHSWG